MFPERIYPLDAETLALFANKGLETPGVAMTGNANGVKVRRIMQTLRDVAGTGDQPLRVLDLACGEGVYAIEAALRGAQVVAIDGRTERMDKGRAAAQRAGLQNLDFQLGDIRKVTAETHGQFDAILFLGILYHLDACDIFPVMANLYGLCRRALIIDTHIAPVVRVSVEHGGLTYEGSKYREHEDDDTQEAKQGRVLASLDNTWSFVLTTESLVRVLLASGFTSVFECHAPLEPCKQSDRITLVALKGERVSVSSYPWVNGKTEAQLDAEIRQFAGTQAPGPRRRGMGGTAKAAANRVLRTLGYEIRSTRGKTAEEKAEEMRRSPSMAKATANRMLGKLGYEIRSVRR